MSKYTAIPRNNRYCLSIINRRLRQIEDTMDYLHDEKAGINPPSNRPSAAASTLRIMWDLRFVLLYCELSSAAIRAELNALIDYGNRK